MDELIKLVADKTGIGPDKARTAVDTVVGFLQDKLPEPVAGQLQNALNGGGREKSAKGGLGGVLGR
ncbi:MAG: hypothetical protein ACREVN_04015 [Gammaproteobacteria bacterium]